MTAGRLETFYACALRLYPAAFREDYADPMLRSFRDALADNSIPHRTLIPLVFRDLVTSLIKEHFAMLRETYSRPVLLFNALVLAGISSVLALALYLIPQQVLRNGANDPQVELATNLAARLELQGITAGLQQGAMDSKGGLVDMTRSLSPFLIVYDDQGRALSSNAQLNGQIPVPPKGIFDYVRTHGEERVTWRPADGVRVAAVVERVNGAQPGFVLAARSLREVQANIQHIRNLACLTWLGMLALIAVGTIALGSMTREKLKGTTV
ncbi:hypothetical protein [Occallatibacter riparius]|uniref:Uncharacterized protein n=1 Tax=Occallatibacter riparius TaxID=1002689 RepID=A0A9J7BXI9_9BACT|nr:hypothetical protein [Occallatibacter riparius]UWZ86642.1 hypothetical protein MOP44_12010 [Occallatibacter riparius]